MLSICLFFKQLNLSMLISFMLIKKEWIDTQIGKARSFLFLLAMKRKEKRSRVYQKTQLYTSFMENVLLFNLKKLSEMTNIPTESRFSM